MLSDLGKNSGCNPYQIEIFLSTIEIVHALNFQMVLQK